MHTRADVHTHVYMCTYTHPDAYAAGEHSSEDTDNTFPIISESRRPNTRPQQLRQEVSHPLSLCCARVANESKNFVCVRIMSWSRVTNRGSEEIYKLICTAIATPCCSLCMLSVACFLVRCSACAHISGGSGHWWSAASCTGRRWWSPDPAASRANTARFAKLSTTKDPHSGAMGFVCGVLIC